MKFYHKILASLLILVMLGSSIRYNIMYGFYYLNQTDFVEWFCVNKDNPELQCNGACELNKLADAQANEHDNSNANTTKSNLSIPLIYIVQDYFVLQEYTFKESIEHLFHYQEAYFYSYIEAPFNPPEYLV